MTDTMYQMVFLGIGVVIFLFCWPVGRRLVLNSLIRCLLGLILIYCVNAIIASFGGNLSVKINEITAMVSALFGTSGVAGLYAFQWILTKI